MPPSGPGEACAVTPRSAASASAPGRSRLQPLGVKKLKGAAQPVVHQSRHGGRGPAPGPGSKAWDAASLDSPVQSPPNWESCQRFLGTGCAERGQIPAQADTRHNARARAAPTATGLASSSSSLHQQSSRQQAPRLGLLYMRPLWRHSPSPSSSPSLLFGAQQLLLLIAHRASISLFPSQSCSLRCAPLAIPAPLSFSPTSPFRPILLSPLLLPRTRFPIPPPPFPPPFHAASARPGSAHRGVAAFFVGGRADFVGGLIGSRGGSGRLRVVGIGA